MRRFPVAFRPPAFASWSSCSRRGIRPSSRSASQPMTGWTSTGLPRFSRISSDREGRPLYPGDNGAHPGLRDLLSRRPVAPHDGRPKLRSDLYLTEFRLTRHQRGFKQFARPVFPSPAATGQNDSRLGFPPSFAPRRPGAGQRTSGVGTGHEHEPGKRSTTSAEPPTSRYH